MRRGASPAAIGAFVLGALALLVVGLVVFGRGLLPGGGEAYTIHFDESLQGLRVGDPVTFRGVRVGEVTGIRAVVDPATNSVRVPVTVDLRQGSLEIAGPAGDGRLIERLVREGLRARLEFQSIVTGQLLVSLDIYPSLAPAPGTVAAPGEIPSVPSTWAGLQRTVDDVILNMPEIAATLADITKALRDLLAGETGAKLQAGIESLAELAVRLGDESGPLAVVTAELPDVLANLEATTSQLPALVQKLDRLAGTSEELIATNDERIAALLEDATGLATATRQVAEQARSLIAENRPGLREFTEQGLPQIMGLVDDATRLVGELGVTIRDLRQNPAGFFLGDRTSEGVRLE